MYLFLHNMDREPAELAVQVYVLDPAVFRVGGGVHVEGEALFLQLFHGGRKIGRAHGDVPAASQEGRFHAFKIGAAEFGFLSMAGFQVEHHAKKLSQLRGFFCIRRIDADMFQFKLTFHGVFSHSFLRQGT